VREGRRREFARFPEFRDEAARERIPDPNAEATFRQAVLDWSAAESERGRGWLAYARELLDLRAREIVPLLADITPGAAGFRKIGKRGLVVSWRCGDGAELWLGANLSAEPLDDAPALPLGRLIVASGVEAAAGAAKGRWPAWSVTWLLTQDTRPTAR